VTRARSRLRVAATHTLWDALALLAASVAAPVWLIAGRNDPARRRRVRQSFGALPPDPPAGRPVWVHAVSVGEVKAARPLVAALAELKPAPPVVISTTTTTGFETARRCFPQLYVFHAPVDAGPIVRRVLRRLDPRLLLLLELEAWPALLKGANDAGVPVAIVNGRMTERSFRGYRRWSWFLPEFERLDLVAAQDETYARRLVELGVAPGRVVVTGNLKHDLLEPPPPARVAELGRALGLSGPRPVFVAGSTHAGEERAAVEAWRAAGGGAACQLVLVPRHPDRIREVARQLEGLDSPYVLRSQAGADRTPETVLLVDTMGELEALFALASVVFLGGSLAPVGGHNVLEPAVAGRALVVGPHLESCRSEADRLLAAGALRVVPDAAGLARELAALLADARERRAMGERARAAAAGLRGAAAADVALLRERGLLSAGRSEAPAAALDLARG
jgi:3-deoxy-D-manno-octulosonic-acid transferase